MNGQLEVLISDSGLDSTKAEAMLQSFQDYFQIVADWETKAKTIVVTDESQIAEMKMARIGRLFLKEKRIAIENTRKKLKEQSLREGKAIDGIANILKALIVPIEEHLEEQEKFAEKKEAARKEAERIEAERIAEEERLAKEKAEREEAIRKAEEQRIEQERIYKENLRLKAEAEAREIAMQKETAKRRLVEEAARKEREKAEFMAKVAREKAESEKRALEEKARKERERAEYLAKVAIEKAEAEKRAVEEKARREKEEALRKAEQERIIHERAIAAEKARAITEKEALINKSKMVQCPFCNHSFDINEI